MDYIKLIKKYNLPLSIRVNIETLEEGGYFAEFIDYPGLSTEASDWPELMYMITDAILTYFEVPIDQAQDFFVYYVPFRQPTPNSNKDHLSQAVKFHALTSIDRYEHSGLRS